MEGSSLFALLHSRSLCPYGYVLSNWMELRGKGYVVPMKPLPCYFGFHRVKWTEEGLECTAEGCGWKKSKYEVQADMHAGAG